MVSKQESRIYFIEKGRLIFVENDLDNPNRIAVSVSSGTTIQVYDESLIGFMSDGKFFSWTLKGYSTKLAKNDAYYIYARLSRTSVDAMVVFSVNRYNLDGSLANAAEGEENLPNEQYYYVLIGEVTATDGTSNREVTYDSGMLGTTKDVYENAGSGNLNEMFQLNKTSDPWYIIAKHAFWELTIKRSLKLIGSLIWGDKELQGVHTTEDLENNVAPDDAHLATSAYTQQIGDKRYLRKDQDDRTEHSLGVGGKLTVDDEATFGSKVTSKMAHIVIGLLSAIGGLFVKSFIKIGDFMSGLQGGYIDEQGNAELESLILRSYLAVPELRYNRITYFEGYNVISPGGGLVIDDYVINDDGSITVTPRLEDGEPCGQFVDDILLGYWHSKTASGDFAGFAKVQFRVKSVDYDSKTFVMTPNPKLELHIEKNMKLAQTGNFMNTERQTYIVIDTRYGNNCITLYDGVNTWTPTAAMAKAWFGKKKGVDIHGIDASTYSAVLQNIIMTGKIYQVDQISGQDIPVPIDKGAWVSGQRYAYYDRVTYNGSLWLCVNENGTTTEPSVSESSWLEQVAAGKGITSYAHWSTSICPVPANTILTFAQRLWISVRETSEPPLGCVTSQGAYVTYKDSEGNTGYVLRNPQTQSEDWVLLLDVSEMKDGDSIQVQYSADTTSWHTTFTEGDLYMRQRVGETSWSAAMRIVGESGQEGRHTEYQFTKNKSEYTQPTTGWQDAPPSLAEGEYLWMRTGVVIPPATAPATWAVVRLSGEKGDAGVGVSDVKEYYLASASASGVTTSTSGWTETPQSVSESKPYLWNYETISYTDSKTVTIDPHIIGRWGANGKNGVGIASVVNQYAKSNSGTVEPVVWYSTPPAIDSTSRFLWNKETITYTDGTTSNIPAHVIGVYGEKGADGADGMGITNYGHWSSSLGTLPALSMVTMGGKSWLSKVSTANPPMGTVMSGGQRVKTKDASGQSVYVLSGLVNTTEWELVTESGRVFTLVPTVGSVVQTKLGFLSPSAFLVNVNQTVGSVSMPYTKGWVVARAMDYNGAMVQVVSASQTSQISITAYGSYTQYVVRLYSSYANARNWQGDFIAEATIPVISDGVDGKDGRTGSEPRPRGQWVSGNTYVYNEKFRDIVVYNGHIYRVRSYGASVTAAPTGGDSDTNWEGADEMKFVATDLLLAQDVYTDKLTVTKVNAKSSDGKTTCTINGETGQLEAYNAILSGTLMTKMFIIEDETSFNEVFSSEDTGNYWLYIKLNKKITHINICWWKYYVSVSGVVRNQAYSIYLDQLSADMEGAEVIIFLGPTQVYFDAGLPVRYKTIKYVDGSFVYDNAEVYIKYGESIRLKYIKTIVHQPSGAKDYYWFRIS